MPPLETLHHGLDQAAVAGWGGGDGVRAELGIPEHAPVVGNLANFKAAKDHPTLLRAAARVRERLPEVRFLLIGQGPLEPEARRLAAELGLDATVVFTGFRTDAHRLLAALDVFTLSSTYEGLPIALIEAMALGRPAVVTRVGGVPEVLADGDQGLLVPPRDPAALADGLLRLLAAPPTQEDAAWLSGWFERTGLGVRVTVEDGALAIGHASPASSGLAGAVVEAVAAAVAGGSWSRLRRCPDCKLVFWDRTRNASKIWCGMYAGTDGRACGSIAKVRRYRARRAASTPGLDRPETRPLSASP
jgi:glycogen synthase